MSHDGLNPARVPYWGVSNPSLGKFRFAMIGRAEMVSFKRSHREMQTGEVLSNCTESCGCYGDLKFAIFPYHQTSTNIGAQCAQSQWGFFFFTIWWNLSCQPIGFYTSGKSHPKPLSPAFPSPYQKILWLSTIKPGMMIEQPDYVTVNYRVTSKLCVCDVKKPKKAVFHCSSKTT